MEIFQLLNKSNCKECKEATCLAFAAAVFQGRRSIHECPDLDQSIVEQYCDREHTGAKIDQELEKALAELKISLKKVDFSKAAQRLGGVYRGGKLTFKILGKDFSVDSEGKFYTDIHVHSWITGPFLNYILNGKGRPVSGSWVPLRELPSGRDWDRFFVQRCEKPIKNVADTHTEFFDDMIHLFSASHVEPIQDSDISVVLYPLPLVPILICYWRPEDGLESDLHIFFDETAEFNLNIDFIYTLGAGLAQMFEKLSYRHA